MRIERYGTQGRGARTLPKLPCGCLTIIGASLLGLIVAGLVLIPLLPQIGLQTAGFQPLGDTDSVLQQRSIAQDAPPPINAAQVAPSNLTLNAGTWGSVSVNPNNADVIMGESALQVSVTNSDLLQICNAISDFCTPNGVPVRNASFDVRAGAVVVNADFLVPDVGFWQRAGLVMQIEGGKRFNVVGVDVNGQLFAAPPDELGDVIAEAERTANDVLRQLSTQISGESYTLDSIYSQANQLIFLLR